MMTTTLSLPTATVLRCDRCNHWLCDYGHTPGTFVRVRCRHCHLEYRIRVLPDGTVTLAQSEYTTTPR